MLSSPLVLDHEADTPNRTERDAALRDSRTSLRVYFACAILAVLTSLLLLAALEAVCWNANRSVPDGAKPFLIDPKGFLNARRGVRQAVRGMHWSHLDPHLGHAHGEYAYEALDCQGTIPGFAISRTSDSEGALRIVALGGSTTDPSTGDNWPVFLHKIIDSRGIDAIVYNGGVAAYSTNQEALKLIRDVLPLEPDIVLSLSGINDMGFLHSMHLHPMVHPFQSRILEAVVHGKPHLLLPNTLEALRRRREESAPRGSRLSGVNYGPKLYTTPADQWERNVRLMHAVAGEFGIDYVSFLQPTLGIGEYVRSPEDDALWKRIEELMSTSYADQMSEFYSEALPRAAAIPYVADLSNVFAGKSGMYRDARHPNTEGQRVIAEAIVRELNARGIIDRGAVEERERLAREDRMASLSARPMHQGVELIRNGSFERWADAVPLHWTVIGGAAAVSTNSTEGENAVRLEVPSAADESGSRLNQYFRHDSVRAGRTLHIAADARADDTHCLGFGVYAIVDGEARLISRDAKGASGWINHPGLRCWTTLLFDAPIPRGVDRDSVRLVVMLRKRATKPAFVDNISVVVSD